MAMAAAPFVALGVAIWFDEIVTLLLRRNVVFKLGAVALIGVGVYAASLVYWNWDNMFHFDPPTLDSAEYLSLVKLREDNPGAFVAVTTEGLIPNVVVHDLMIRSSFGNPDVFTNGLPSEPEFAEAMRWDAPFAIGIHDGYQDGLRFLGYLPYPDTPLDESGNPALWVKPDALPYAFVIQREALARNVGVVTRSIVDPVASMAHHLDRIEFTLNTYKFNSLLVVQEVDYPGWTVTVDGQPAEIESFDGALAVALPLNAHEVVVHLSRAAAGRRADRLRDHAGAVRDLSAAARPLDRRDALSTRRAGSAPGWIAPARGLEPIFLNPLDLL